MVVSTVTEVTAVFNSLLNWFTDALSGVTELFYDPSNGLTFIGTVTVIGVGIAISTMIVATIRSLLRLK